MTPDELADIKETLAQINQGFELPPSDELIEQVAAELLLEKQKAVITDRLRICSIPKLINLQAHFDEKRLKEIRDNLAS